MLHLVTLLSLMLCKNSNETPNAEYFFRKSNYGIEVIKLQSNGTFEAFGYQSLSPELSVYNYSQGIFSKENNVALLNVSLIDSVVLNVAETNQKKDDDIFFRNSVRILGDKNFVNMLGHFDFDNLNHLGHVNEIKLCVIDSINNFYYQTYNYELNKFNDIITQFKPKLIYISVGDHIVSKKYQVADMLSNCFDIVPSYSHLISNFKRNYFSNHRIEIREGKIFDLVTKSEYIKFAPSDTTKSIDHIAIEKYSSK